MKNLFYSLSVCIQKLESDNLFSLNGYIIILKQIKFFKNLRITINNENSKRE